TSPHRTHAHRHLRSSPTRRSSDLTEVFTGIDEALHRDVHDTARAVVLVERRVQALHDFGMIGSERARAVQSLLLAAPVADQDRADRKSTRLNSSHVKTSYAVFSFN